MSYINPKSDIRVNGDNSVVSPVVQRSGLNSGNIGNQQGDQLTFPIVHRDLRRAVASGIILIGGER